MTQNILTSILFQKTAKLQEDQLKQIVILQQEIDEVRNRLKNYGIQDKFPQKVVQYHIAKYQNSQLRQQKPKTFLLNSEITQKILPAKKQQNNVEKILAQWYKFNNKIFLSIYSRNKISSSFHKSQQIKHTQYCSPQAKRPHFQSALKNIQSPYDSRYSEVSYHSNHKNQQSPLGMRLLHIQLQAFLMSTANISENGSNLPTNTNSIQQKRLTTTIPDFEPADINILHQENFSLKEQNLQLLLQIEQMREQIQGQTSEQQLLSPRSDNTTKYQPDFRYLVQKNTSLSYQVHLLRDEIYKLQKQVQIYNQQNKNVENCFEDEKIKYTGLILLLNEKIAQQEGVIHHLEEFIKQKSMELDYLENTTI